MGYGEGFGENAGADVCFEGVFVVAEPGGVVEVRGKGGGVAGLLGGEVQIDYFFEFVSCTMRGR